MANSRIGIIGNGNVGSAIARGLERAGHEVRSAGHEPGKVREVAKWAETVILAVPFGERQNAVREAGTEALSGKTLVDVTNALGEGMRFAGSLEQSGAEELQGWAGSQCHVVKAFNTVFAKHMDTGVALGEPLTLFCAGDDAGAREQVLALGHDIGFDAIDAGPLENARWLEALGYLNITLAYKVGLGGDGGFRYVHALPASASRPARTAQRTDRTQEPAAASRPPPAPAQRL